MKKPFRNSAGVVPEIDVTQMQPDIIVGGHTTPLLKRLSAAERQELDAWANEQPVGENGAVDLRKWPGWLGASASRMVTNKPLKTVAMIKWTDAPNGSAGHVDGRLVVQIRKLGVGGWSAGWRNGMRWDVSDQSTQVKEQSSRHFKSREAAKRAVEDCMRSNSNED